MNATVPQLYVSWRQHLDHRGVSIPDLNDFLAFGSLSQLERLRPILEQIEPQAIGPLRYALSIKRSEYNARRGSKAKGGLRGRALQFSIAKQDLLPSFKATLKRQRRMREMMDAGEDVFDSDLKPMPWSSIHDAETILRMISKSCLVRDKSPSLSMKTVGFWLDDAESRNCQPRGLGCQIGKLALFVKHHEGKKSKLAKGLRKLAKRYKKRGELSPKRKDRASLEHLDDIGQVWMQALDLFAEAQKTGRGTYGRYKLFLEAAAIALSVVVPLRIGDLHRLQFGRDLVRTHSGWKLEMIVTEKTKAEYSRDELWPELTQFLDALLIEDAPAADFWVGYHDREGTPVFSRDGGKTGFLRGWISKVWYEHFGCGEHFIRTLWHEAVYDDQTDQTGVALAMCGQKSMRTAQEYHREAAKKRKAKQGRSNISNFQRRSDHVKLDGD